MLSYTCTVEVTNNRQQFSTSNVEVSVYHMEVTEMHPNNGEMSGGTIITVHGFGFLRHQESRCLFGDHVVSDIVIVSSTVVTCVAPSLASGYYEVQISNNLAHDFIGNSLMYYAYEPLVINGIYPSSGITFAYHIQFFQGTEKTEIYSFLIEKYPCCSCWREFFQFD